MSLFSFQLSFVSQFHEKSSNTMKDFVVTVVKEVEEIGRLDATPYSV